LEDVWQSYPLDSASLDILKVPGLSDKYINVPVTDIEAKYAKLLCVKNSSQFAVIHLLHN
jgi:hypothetical protein